MIMTIRFFLNEGLPVAEYGFPEEDAGDFKCDLEFENVSRVIKFVATTECDPEAGEGSDKPYAVVTYEIDVMDYDTFKANFMKTDSAYEMVTNPFA